MMSRMALITSALNLLAIPEPVTGDGPAISTIVTNSIGMKFAEIPSGEYEMGSPLKAQDIDAQQNEWPQHKVRISAFRMGVTEVSVGQFRLFVDPTGHKMRADIGGGVRTWNSPGFDQTDQHPVAVVGWNDTVLFCNWLSRLEGLKEFYKIRGDQITVPDWKVNGYRLPTEAEWEYACRAGTKTRFSCPDNELGRYAWYDGNAAKRTHPVGEKLANKFGLFDMHGNVAEWCWDSSDRYSEGPAGATLDPRGPQWIDHPYRVFRGGSWDYPALYARSAKRDRARPQARSNFVGFRVALNQPGDQSK